MVKSIFFISRKGTIKIYSKNKVVFESYRFYEKDNLLNNAISMVLRSDNNLKKAFNSLNYLLSEYFFESQDDISDDIFEYHPVFIEFNKTVNEITRHAKVLNSTEINKFKICFEFVSPLNSKSIEAKSKFISIGRNKSIKFIIESYNGKNINGPDKIRKFEFTVEK